MLLIAGLVRMVRNRTEYHSHPQPQWALVLDEPRLIHLRLNKRILVSASASSATNCVSAPCSRSTSNASVDSWVLVVNVMVLKSSTEAPRNVLDGTPSVKATTVHEHDCRQCRKTNADCLIECRRQIGNRTRMLRLFCSCGTQSTHSRIALLRRILKLSVQK